MAHRIPSEKQEQYSQRTLGLLLSGTHQCWLVYDEDSEGNRKIHAIGISCIMQDSLLNMKCLHILSFYGYRLLTDELALDSFEKFHAYAKANKCDVVKMETNVKRVKDLAELIGLKEDSTNYSIYV